LIEIEKMAASEVGLAEAVKAANSNDEYDGGQNREREQS